MKPVVHIARFLVGALFIFSGLVKAIDPLGLTYKMQEFFEVWIQDGYFVKAVSFLNEHAFLFSVAMITAEVVLGVALLIGWRKKLVLWLLLLLMLLFTFLTAFVLFSGKIRACGCFGDCIPLTPIQTFTKDLVLLALVFLLIARQQYIQPLLGYRIPFAAVVLALIGTLFLQHYVIEHLPLVDCLPYKKGNNILELRKMPANAIPDKFAYSFLYEKAGQQKEFTTDALPDSSWKFVERKQTLVQKGSNNVPLINDFILSDSTGADSTAAILSQPLYYLFFVKEVADDTDKWLSVFTDIVKNATKGNVPLYVITADPAGSQKFFNSQHNFKLPVYTCDAIAIKTAARANPTLYVMTGAVVKEKYSWADMDALLK